MYLKLKYILSIFIAETHLIR